MYKKNARDRAELKSKCEQFLAWLGDFIFVHSLQDRRADKFKSNALKIVLNLFPYLEEVSDHQYLCQLIPSWVLPVMQLEPNLSPSHQQRLMEANSDPAK